MHEELDVSVVVPTYSRADSLRRLLGALARQTLAPNRYEVVVAIDGSCDGTLELVTDYHAPYPLQSIWQEHKGRAAARNAAIRRSSAAIVVFLDDDMEPAPECVEAHLNSHAGRRRRCVLGATPIALTSGDPPVAKYFQTKFETHLRRLAEPGHQFVARDFYTGNLSLELQLLFEVGLFDENFTRYGNEDVDLALRLLAAGAETVYEPRALACQRLNKNLLGAIDDAQSKGQTALFLARKSPEYLPELRLATYGRASIRWRFVRRILLSASRRSRRVPHLLTRLARLLEQSRVRLPWGYYDLLLDFFFWLGVERGFEDLDGDGAAATDSFLLH